MRLPTADSERGSVAAEFAAAVPAVVMVLALCLVGFQIAGAQLRLQDAAAMTARSLGRGAHGSSAAWTGLDSVSVQTSASGDLVCARLSSRVVAAGMFGITISASSCALGGGQ